MNQKGFTPVLIVLIITITLGLIGGAYYLGVKNYNVFQVKTTLPEADVNTKPPNVDTLESNKDQEIGLKTYTNTKFKFSFEHSLTLREEVNEVKDDPNILGSVSFIALGTDAYQGLIIHNNPKSLTIKDWWLANYDQTKIDLIGRHNGPVKKEDFRFETKKFDNVEAVYIVNDNLDPSSVYIQNKNYIIEISSVIDTEKTLQTFRFID